MAKSGGIVRIRNVSDFVEPGQKCVLPLRQNVDGQKTGAASKKLVGIHAKSIGTHAKSAPSAATGQRVRMSLDDCLVCSGCVTTGAVEFF